MYIAVHRLSCPSFSVCSIALFFIVFECFLNGMAELTRFGDRSFYCSWWLSTTFAVRDCFGWPRTCVYMCEALGTGRSHSPGESFGSGCICPLRISPYTVRYLSISTHHLQEFSRLWNRPVHEVLLRHCYLDGMRRWNLSPGKAMIATFAVSMVSLCCGKYPRGRLMCSLVRTCWCM